MTKQIKRNRETGDFDMFYLGHYIGSRRTASEARAELDKQAYAALTKGVRP